jgi:hypothetical protein
MPRHPSGLTRFQASRLRRAPTPSNHHPLLKEFFLLCDASPLTYAQLAKRAGVAESQIGKWRTRANHPRLPNFDAALQALGYQLQIIKIEKETHDG